MNIHDLRAHQAQFKHRIEGTIKGREKWYQLREEFVKYFDRSTIKKMDIDDYVLGVDKSSKKFNFCYALEQQLSGLGGIVGGTAEKFGVYYSKDDQEYKFTKKFGTTYQEAFLNVKKAILALLDAGEAHDLIAIINNPISPMLKGKILSIYYPNDYLNIFSEDHLDHFLVWYGLDDPSLKSPVRKREALMEFKRRDLFMKEWPVDIFTHFLYTSYPGFGKYKEQSNDDALSDTLEDDYGLPNFPPNPTPKYIEMEISPTVFTANNGAGSRRKPKPKPDYELEARKLKMFGDRGESIVWNLERDRLEKIGRSDLANKVKWVSRESDTYGYDIKSFEEDGTTRLIEVKATQSKAGNASFFLTANELNTAMEQGNYYIYIVYDILSKSPEVWPIKNPFNPENEHVLKTPVNYRVNIHAAKASKH